MLPQWAGHTLVARMNASIELLQQLPASILVIRDGTVVWVNDVSVHLLEADEAAQVIGRPLSEFIYAVDQQRSAQRIHDVAQAQAGQANRSAEFRIRSCRGHLRMVLASSVSVLWEGQPAVLVNALDMTHQSEIQEQLRESEHNFRRVFESMQDVYYRTDAQGVVQHVGPGVRRVLGYEPHEIEGRTAESYYPQSTDRDAFKAAIMAHGEVSDFPGQMVRRDGQVIDISISSHALYEPDGSFSGVEGIYRDVTHRKNLERELHRLATTDMLTGIANRRALLEAADAAFALPSGQHLSVLVLDLDHFKNINDAYGHHEGDHALTEFTRAVAGQLRSSDLFGRLGGEEFAIVLPGACAPAAQEVAHRVLQATASHPITSAHGLSYRLTTSIGLATRQPADTRLADILERADKALYQAKNGGRNQIYVHE